MDRVTIIGVVRASEKVTGHASYFLNLMLGTKKLMEWAQTLHTFLSDCYMNHQPETGVHSSIYEKWTGWFREKTEHLRSNGSYFATYL